MPLSMHLPALPFAPLQVTLLRVAVVLPRLLLHLLLLHRGARLHPLISPKGAATTATHLPHTARRLRTVTRRRAHLAVSGVV